MRKKPHDKRMFIPRIALLVLFAIFSHGCASDDGTVLGSEPPYPYATSNADPASYGADGFTFNKTRPRRSANDFMFYYKRCTLTGERSYYSRTDYWCNEP